jgi:DNA repair exonuclease SbcCD ATPase subunit
VSFEEEELLQSFGFYKPLYDCADSAAYRQLLEKVRDRQKEMVKERTALRTETVFSIENDRTGGKKIAKNLEKLILRAFNGECDATIDKVTFSNLDAITARITKAYQDLNDLCQVVGISISQAYLNAKIEELHVCYEYQRKLKEEREEQRKIREEMREQARLVKEIEDARKKIEKEETHFNQVIAELQARMDAAAASEKAQYEAKLREYEEQLAAVQKDKEEVAFREQSTRAGYVYIISNLGSFGEDAYKIGVTRRLEPQERIDELGDASVPFDFDVHAMIFSEDAPSLEGALHEHFADRTINKVNPRKEFFRVRLDEIEEVVRTHHNKVVEFTRLAKAEDYRLTLVKERALAQDAAGKGIANG